MDIEVLGGYILTAAVFFGLGHILALHPLWVPAIIAKLKSFRSKPTPTPTPEPLPFSIVGESGPELLVPTPPVVPTTPKTRPAWVKEQ